MTLRQGLIVGQFFSTTSTVTSFCSTTKRCYNPCCLSIFRKLCHIRIIMPLCLWEPKKRSSGSWHKRWLKKLSTPGITNRWLTNFQQMTCQKFHCFTILPECINLHVIRSAYKVSALNSMLFFSAVENPLRFIREFSHSCKYPKIVVSNH